jgi:hypothetical protein
MAMHGAALKKVQASLTARKSFRNSTGSMRGEWLPTYISRGMYEGVLPHAADVEYVVYSYGTPIAWVLKRGDVVIPDVKYSVTTTNHQSQCALNL